MDRLAWGDALNLFAAGDQLLEIMTKERPRENVIDVPALRMGFPAQITHFGEYADSLRLNSMLDSAGEKRRWIFADIGIVEEKVHINVLFEHLNGALNR